MHDDSQRILEILAEAKRLAKEYRALTGRPLGITGEVAEDEAIQLLNLEPAPVRQPGYDAVRRSRGAVQRLPIKGRVILPGAKRSQRLGRIRLDADWDVVLVVIMDADFEAVKIHEASRPAVEAALEAPGSKARNERAVSQFIAVAECVWSRNRGPK